MAKWLIVKRSVLTDVQLAELPASDDPDAFPPEDRLELVGVATANADQPKAAAESIADDPNADYIAVRWDNATVFSADPKPVALTVIDPKKATK